MKITVWSDLHLEFSNFEPVNTGADVLILAGDILVAEDFRVTETSSKRWIADQYLDFLKTCSELYPRVLYVAGNHEHYHGKFDRTISILKSVCSKFDNIHVLDGESIKIDDVQFIGATLWADFDNHNPMTMYRVQNGLNDYKSIVYHANGQYRKLRPADTLIKHVEHKAYIKNQLAATEDVKTVCITHHAPCFASIPDHLRSKSEVNGAYASDLSNLILDQKNAALWVHGHTHCAADYSIGLTRVICNPRGYHSENYSEHTGWDQHLVVEV